MAFPTKSGQKFGSAYVAKRKDAEHEKMAAAAPTGTDEGTALMKKTAPAAPVAGAPGEQKPEGIGAPPEDPKQVVAAHGKASTIHIAHDHKSGKHHVVSMHEDGSVHESEHPDAKSAHDAAAALAGSSDMPTGTEGPEALASAQEPDGFQMPRLA